MANGRMIVNAICADKKINDLSNDTSRLAFTWLVTFADCEGRTYGDPGMVRSMLFPRRDDVSLEDMERYIREWDAAGLIEWYEAEGDKWIFFPKFEKNQPGLRKEKETPSRIPEPVRQYVAEPENADEIEDGVTADLGRSNDGVSTSEVRNKLKEVKLKEKKLIESAIFSTEMIPSIFSGVTGMTSIPGGGDEITHCSEVIEKIYNQRDRSKEQTIEYLRPFYLSWIKRKGKDNRPYSKTNNAWLTTWAVAGEIPDEKIERERPASGPVRVTR